jgi:hypothetical protein
MRALPGAIWCQAAVMSGGERRTEVSAMNRMRRALCVGLLLAAPAPVIGFEGTLKLRSVAVERDELGKVTGGKTPDAAQTLAIMPDKLLAAKDANPQVFESYMYVSGPKVRMDAPLDKGQEGYAIIDTEKHTTLFVVPSEKRYLEWSEADAKAMGDKMAQLEKVMKERMGSLPPEQRAQAEAILKNMQGATGSPEPKIDLKATGKTQTVNGMQAVGYEVKTNGETLVGWVTQDEPELSKMLRTVQERLEQMTPPAMRGKQAARTSLAAKGFPVMVQTLAADHYRVEEITSVERKPVPADLFVVPKDYTKTTGRDAMKNVPEKPKP